MAYRKILIYFLWIFITQFLFVHTQAQGDLVNQFRVFICTTNPKYSSISGKFCNCNSKVISCDFSTFKEKNRTIVELLADWSKDEVKKLCLCNTPINLQVILGEDFLSQYHDRLNRVDLYNIKGPLWIQDAFSLHFSGDLYMSNVDMLGNIFPYEFGRGLLHPENLIDTSDLPCCSKIHTPKLKPPTLYVENSTIYGIQNSGINSGHWWSNLIFESVNFNYIDKYGIELNNNGLNASFTNCNFHNVSRVGIAANELSNLLVAHSTFGPSCHPLPFGARAIDDNSTVAFIQNDFQMNDTYLEIDGTNVAIWFNSFNKWSPKTFRHLNGTSQLNRVVSIEFNAVENFEVMENNIPQLKSFDTKVIFNENLLVHCSCQKIELLKLPILMRNFTQRCHSHEGGMDHTCHLKLAEVQTQCHRSSMPQFDSLCSKDDSHPQIYSKLKSFLDIEKIFQAHSSKYSFKIEPNGFIQQMLQHVNSSFGIPKLKEESIKPKKYSGNSKSAKQLTFEYFSIIIILLGITLIA